MFKASAEIFRNETLGASMNLCDLRLVVDLLPEGS